MKQIANDTAKGGIDWSRIYGFNYQPSYGRNATEIWLTKYDEATVQRELAHAQSFFPAMNTVRLWFSHEPYYQDPSRFMGNVQRTLDICGKLGIRVIPVLFNNWHSFPAFGGITPELIRYWFGEYGQMGSAQNYLFKPFLNSIWGRYASDERILAWDLCNEPYNNFCPEIIPWLMHLYRWGKSMNVRQPISVSLQSDLKQLRECDDCCDVYMIHPYFAKQENIEAVSAYAQSRGKSCVATECCWGALEDEHRVQHIMNDLSILSGFHIGFLPHALQESLVADLHRPQFASLGIVSSAAYMAFINMEGDLRRGHDCFNQFCR